MMSTHPAMTMTLRRIPSPHPFARSNGNGGPATKSLPPALARLRDVCCIACAAIGLAASLNLGTCEPPKRPSIFASRATPPGSASLSTLAPIMQTAPRKGEGVPRQSLRCAAPKAARTVSKMPRSAGADAFAV
jgi:hypothetical protein